MAGGTRTFSRMVGFQNPAIRTIQKCAKGQCVGVILVHQARDSGSILEGVGVVDGAVTASLKRGAGEYFS